MKKKSIALTLSALALTATVAVGGTLAYLSDVTETAQNVFASSNKITGKLDEKDWSREEASKYTPGEVLSKTPIITLEKGSVDSYVAMVVSCTDNDGKSISVSDFESNYGDIMYNKTSDLNTAWKYIGYKENVGDVYVLTDASGNAVALDAESADAAAPALFDSVKVNVGIQEVWTKTTEITNYYFIDENGNKVPLTSNSQVTENTDYYNQAGEKVDITTLPAFQINVTGYLTQATNVDSTTGLTNLLTMTGYSK